ncbi:MAG: RnfABCDGE type electron transport complex subunit G [Eudoraea sp.]|nr:RnfABCDGE type electron transport complex subunit G [Eudoraea sp.]MBT8209843.1 RnfABCDGE type electron transport complex subunit G [Eudoraea sp.]MBT8223064.1 RnfABCDGE type electron transport complex subunit G [Eudoraea sp.]NNK29427.1 RnfABCDGE type electron transport complex subunit G [Flavobacteriaceae bacterium]
MKKKESTLVNMVVVLFVITMAAGLSLGFVNDLTLEPKARARLAKKVKALNAVLPQYDNNPVSEVLRFKIEEAKDSIEFYPASKDSVIVGAAVTGASEKGYSGLVKLMVGFELDGSIKNIAVLEQKETPGLGTKMKGEKFLRQFRGKNPATFDLKVKKDGGEVDALAGATISTRAFSEATQQAYDVYKEVSEMEIKSDN